MHFYFAGPNVYKFLLEKLPLLKYRYIMVKKIYMLAMCLVGCSLFAAKDGGKDYTKYVMPEAGSDSVKELSSGNLYPCMAVPFGMNFWSPQSKDFSKRWWYAYSDTMFSAIRLTRQPSPWIGDYGPLCFMPTVGEKKSLEKDRQSWISHKAETIKPHYYSVYLADYDTTLELTPTSRGAHMRVSYPDSDKANFVIDALSGKSFVKIIPEKNMVVGKSVWVNSRGKRAEGDFANYFVLKFDKPLSSYAVFDGKNIHEGELQTKDTDAQKGAILTFKTKKGDPLNVKVATSFISLQQAELNFEREVANNSFDECKANSKAQWNKYLSKIDVCDNDIDDYPNVKMFYTTFFRTLLFPRDFYEIDKDGNEVHYSPFNGKIEKGRMTTDNGYWDTFRAVHPFFNLLLPEQSEKVLEGMQNTFKEGGWFPEWASPGYVNCMIGSNSSSIAASAYLFVSKSAADGEVLWQAMNKGAESFCEKNNSLGRAGAKEYNTLGYVPNDINLKESAARTLEYAYADYCIMKFAQSLGKDKATIEKFAKRAQNYRNLFNEKYSLMVGRNSKGEFKKNFNPVEWGGDFTEGNSLQYTWSVFHDINGLAKLMGGKEKAAKQLDDMFAMAPIFDVGAYKIVIHEIREMQIMNFGQYAHGNQPIQHGVYVYNWLGQPWKAQYWARRIMQKLYKPEVAGYCGDEDNGQTSAWYVLSALGFYPVCPVDGEFAIGSPLFRKVKVAMPNGKTLTIKAKNNSPENVYIKSLKINGKKYDKNFFTFDQLRNGGEIVMEMSDKPNTSRGVAEESAPSSMTK